METKTQTIEFTSLKDCSFIQKNKISKLAKLNINTVLDLIMHFPKKYQDRTQATEIANLQPNENHVIKGKIHSIKKTSQQTIVTVKDNTGYIDLKYFSFSEKQEKIYRKNTKIKAYGMVRLKYNLEIMHPETTIIFEDTESTKLTPIYSLTKNLSQYEIRTIIQNCLKQLDDDNFPELIPKELSKEKNTLLDAIMFLHNPERDAYQDLMHHRHPAQIRVIKEELLAHNLKLMIIKHKNQGKKIEPIIINEAESKEIKEFMQCLPFKLTKSQLNIIKVIKQDLAKEKPMSRLIQGDVGSGKTILAVIASLIVAKKNHQIAFLAPTGILAEQHKSTFDQYLSRYNIKTALITSKTTKAQRHKELIKIADGTTNIVIGTHAILQPDIVYKDLSLIIIDEQHKFGVAQRMLLAKKSPDNKGLHQMIMTATPIPRTLALSQYSNLETSTIDELPTNRQPVETKNICNTRRGEVLNRVKQTIKKQKTQAYWVCTLIEKSETKNCENAENIAKEISEEAPELTIEVIHGKMHNKTKNAIIERFKNGEIQILVATTVIEVGIDIANANLIIIENPEQLGLAQLHQLRGRVGRSDIKSYCIMLYQEPLSESAIKRLDIIQSTNNGFHIAEQDLKLRGPGDALGIKQSGALIMRMADIERDYNINQKTKFAAKIIYKDHRQKSHQILKRWI